MAGIACVANAQTFQIGPNASKSPQAKQGQPAKKQNKQQGSLGWGSNIQNARIARAAVLALQHGQKAQALDYARQAVKSAPNDPKLWFLLGYAARLNNRLQESEDAYHRGLSLDPNSLDGTSGLAQDLSLAGRTGEAMKLLNQVVTADPRRRADLVLLGEMHMRSKDYQGGLEYLNRAERLRPDARSEVLLAISNEQLNHLDVANHYLQMAKHRAPNNPEVQRTVAGYYRQVGKYEQAIAELKAIKNPKPDVLAELGYTYQLDGKLSEAAKTYARAANSVPKDMKLQLSAAEAEVAAGAPEDADPFLKRAASIDPDNYRLHAVRGTIARIQDRGEDAIKEYQAALAHLPANVTEGPLYGIQLHVQLMQLYKAQGDENAASQQLATAQQQINAVNQQGAARDPYLRLRATIKMASGNLDGALADVHEALAADPKNIADLQLNGDVLMKMGRTEDAINAYKRVLDQDGKNRSALISLGYASRTANRPGDAEKYFKRLAQVDPSSYIPYLALGDLDTSRKQYASAEANYTKAHSLAPKRSTVVAGGMNAAIEAHNLNLAGDWLKRATEAMNRDPRLLREEERYYSFKGDYAKSAELGEKVLPLLPHDRDVVVYLGYDLLHLERWDELLKLATDNLDKFPKEPDLPLLAGYVHKHQGKDEEARKDFSEAIARDPEIVTAYVNRGYTESDLHDPKAAASDFEAAIKREPKNGEAHLGLAFADLNLDKPQAAIKQSEVAEQIMGDGKELHVIRATAYGREGMLTRAEGEFRAALKFDPNDGSLHQGLGNALFSERRYHDAVDELNIAAKDAPDNATTYALLARGYASLGDRNQTISNAQKAEKLAQGAPIPDNDVQEPLQSTIYVATGEAYSTIGDQKAAMDRFTRALETPKSNRVSVRLAIARLMEQKGHEDDAERQIALGLMEAGAGDTHPVSGTQFIQVADLFRGMHDYELSQEYLQRAKTAGAPDAQVRVGMANNYLAVGDTTRAKAELAAVNMTTDGGPEYQYLLAEANVARQEHQSAEALTAFAQATQAEGEDETAQAGLLQLGGEEGWRITPKVSMLSNVTVSPLFEDSTVYELDSKLDASFAVPPSDTSLLPPPRSSIQTLWTDAFHLHLEHAPPAGGFFQLRNSRGQISVPATNSIVNRNTFDYTMNFGVAPSFRLGTSAISLSSGVQATIRRDAESPRSMNQNLFREYTYVSTGSFFNAISMNGYVIHEAGPFTESDLHSRLFSASVNFRVGSPWGRTALLTGWGESKQTFTPRNFQNYFTSSYIGLEHRFGDHLDVRAMLEYIRAWRVIEYPGGTPLNPGPSITRNGTAQDLRPGAWVSYGFRRNWDLQVTSSYSSERSFHVYDATQNGFSLSYALPVHRRLADESGPLNVAYPIRITGGVQADTFFNFPNGHNQQVRPYIGITIF